MADEALDVNLDIKVRFWVCLNRDHKTVTWIDDVAHCEQCGLTSEMTRRWANDVRRYHRDEVIEENTRLMGLLLDAEAALEDLGACDLPECPDEMCLRILPRIRAALKEKPHG